MSDKRSFFAVDDYGMGGIWMVMEARSPQEIEQRYPELTAFAEPPAVFSAEEQARIKNRRHFDIDEEPRGYLAAVVADRDAQDE